MKELTIGWWQSWFIPMYFSMKAMGKRWGEAEKSGVLLELGMGDGTRLNRMFCDEFGATLTSTERKASYFEEYKQYSDRPFRVDAGDADFVCQHEYLAECDIGLVDGVNGDRVMCTNLLLHRDRTRVVIVHDTDDPGGPRDTYHWDWVIVPEGVQKYTYEGACPRTDIYCKDDDLFKEIVAGLEDNGFDVAKDWAMKKIALEQSQGKVEVAG